MSALAEEVQLRFCEGRTDGAVMNGRMMFGGVVAKIGGSGFPEMAKLALHRAASEPV